MSRSVKKICVFYKIVKNWKSYSCLRKNVFISIKAYTFCYANKKIRLTENIAIMLESLMVAICYL